MKERVILVDENDSVLGTEEKLTAHEKGRLHRAFSVFVFNEAGDMLLQQRARGKYHSGGLWSNACCSHPRPDEDTAEAAGRRLQEELGFTCPVEAAFSMIYRADVGADLVEHEFDHVFLARWDGEPDPDPEEVDGWRWVSIAELQEEVGTEPERFTYWFRKALDELQDRGFLAKEADSRVA